MKWEDENKMQTKVVNNKPRINDDTNTKVLNTK
jgi:hypothetical protein